MKIQVMSDLHLEFHRDNGFSFIESLDASEADVLVLAGDIFPLRFLDQAKPLIEAFCDKFKHVIYVCGNHEYYGTNPVSAHNVLHSIAIGISNFHVLENSSVTVNGQRFIGGTMWFGQQPDDGLYECMISDFSLIKRFKPWVYNQNSAFRRLALDIKPSDVVVTHHYPSTESMHPQYEGSKINRFFHCDMETEIYTLQPKLWIHGHTHESFDYKLDKTRVICNPHGYINERRDSKRFNNKLLIEV